MTIVVLTLGNFAITGQPAMTQGSYIDQLIYLQKGESSPPSQAYSWYLDIIIILLLVKFISNI